MNLSTIGYWIIESFEGISKNRKTFFIGLGTMLVVLCLIGSLYILYLNANSFMGDVKQDESKVNLYVKDLSNDDITNILNQLYSIDGISDVEYISEEEAYEKAKEMNIDVEGIDPEEGVFSASFILTVEGTSDGDITPIRNAVYAIPTLYQSIHKADGFNEAEKTIKIAISVKIITITILILIVIMGCFLMMNSIKLALYARRKEISIMKYVGATDTYARAPFVIEGLIIALLAAGITLVLTNVVYGGILNVTSGVQLFSFLVPMGEVLRSVSILLVLVSVGIGTIGSSMSISKYLDV